MERRRAPAKELQPSQAIEECEEYHVDLASAAALDLSIEPDIRQWGIRASLERLQLPALGKRNLAPGDSAVVQNCHGREVGTASGYPLAVIWGEIVQNIFVDNLAVDTSQRSQGPRSKHSGRC